ncbi:FUSC family protein [Rhizobium sp. KVB221]|uniref:FUSC family protein n=1 Tax=Rhizobium setariae TaxID=2801340 RepID=A0A936YR68_9HYPH|nr:FUSC family protein [Rhizobium setariae]MBL0371296.1 FUSC family protein [Rhizobium setariae]
MWSEAAARLKAAFTRVVASAVAAALAYWLARALLGQPRPIFAAITAIICLAPGILNHFRQSVNLLIGVTIGIVMGELVFLIPQEIGELRIAIAVFVAMFLGSALSPLPVVPIQAGVSALLVILMGPQTAGVPRFLDVIIGIVVGLTIAVVFFRSRLKISD